VGRRRAKAGQSNTGYRGGLPWAAIAGVGAANNSSKDNNAKDLREKSSLPGGDGLDLKLRPVSSIEQASLAAFSTIDL
jgi:hypothetical protein